MRDVVEMVAREICGEHRTGHDRWGQSRRTCRSMLPHLHASKIHPQFAFDVRCRCSMFASFCPNASKVHPHLFYRDVVHANEYGEQILSKILLEFFRQ